MIKSKKLVILPQHQMGGNKRGRPGKSSFSHMMTLAPGVSLSSKSIYSQINTTTKATVDEELVESDDEGEDFVKNPPKVLGQGARVVIKKKPAD